MVDDGKWIFCVYKYASSAGPGSSYCGDIFGQPRVSPRTESNSGLAGSNAAGTELSSQVGLSKPHMYDDRRRSGHLHPTDSHCRVILIIVLSAPSDAQ